MFWSESFFYYQWFIVKYKYTFSKHLPSLPSLNSGTHNSRSVFYHIIIIVQLFDFQLNSLSFSLSLSFVICKCIEPKNALVCHYVCRYIYLYFTTGVANFRLASFKDLKQKFHLKYFSLHTRHSFKSVLLKRYEKQL